MGKQSKTQLSPGVSKERNILRRPDRIRTEEKRRKYQQCSFATRYNYLLKIHGNVHTSEKPFQCRRCPFKPAYKSSLERHEQWHGGERPHKCPLCPFAAARKSHLEIHRRVHTREKPFKCQHCPYVTTQKSYVITHERTHTGERPFKCHRCNYASARSSSLKTHQKIHIRGNLSKLEHPAKLRSSLAPQKRLQSGRKSLKCKIPSEVTTVASDKYGKITDLGLSRKQSNRIPTHLQDLLEGEEESYCEDTQLDSWDDQEINESSSQARFEIFICKECNYALLSAKELCMHYTFCHKLPAVRLNIEKTDC